MSPKLAARDADKGLGVQRHQPEQTLLYQLIGQHYPAFITQLAAQGSILPGYVQREFEEYFKCGRLEHGFLRVCCGLVMLNTWWRSVVNAGVFAPVVGLRVGWKVQRFWSMKSCLMSQCASGY